MGEVGTKEVPALAEEVEGELLDVPFIDNKEKATIKGILSDQ